MKIGVNNELNVISSVLFAFVQNLHNNNNNKVILKVKKIIEMAGSQYKNFLSKYWLLIVQTSQ